MLKCKMCGAENTSNRNPYLPMKTDSSKSWFALHNNKPHELELNKDALRMVVF